MEYKIGTRGSALALTQAEKVCGALRENYPEHSFQIVIVKTTGDRVSNLPMRDVGTTGIFTRELEEQLRSGQIDIAIHSMKDLPAALPEGMTLCNVLKREDPRDVLITPDGKNLSSLRKGAVIGTGSLRRKYQLLALRPDLQIVDIRGNIDTRIRKMEEQHMDGIVLAAAALKRLNLGHKVSQFFTTEELLPAPTQGILGAEFLSDRQDIAAMLNAIGDPDDSRAMAAERFFLAFMRVGCHMPVAAFCQQENQQLRMRAMYGNEDGSNIRFAEETGVSPEDLARKVAAYFA